MSDTRFAPVDAPEREAVKEPPKRWFNWYKILTGGIDLDTSVPRTAGEIVQGNTAWPSKDVAEQVAAEQLTICLRKNQGVESSIYLGAFPEGERP